MRRPHVAATLALLALLLAPRATLQAQRAATDTVVRMARTLLGKLVRINTSLSEGATTPAARMLAAEFIAAGFPAADVRLLGPNAKQQNLVVRWRGRTRAAAVVFNVHLDVVEAPKLAWSTDPFLLTEKGGYLYGRGVLDDKGPAAALAAAAMHAKQQGVTPERDLVLTFTAGEETSENNGVEWLLAKHRALIDGEYALNLDAGGAEMGEDGPRSFAIEAAEKIYLDLIVTARGPGGHSSVPSGATPIDHLVAAIREINEYRFPVKLNPVVRAFFERTGALGGEHSAAMTALAKEPDDLRAQSTLLASPFMNALLRTTCITTMLRGGTAPNAIPQEVSAIVNCRVLPGESIDAVIATLKREVADTAITFTISGPVVVSSPSMPPPAIVTMIERVVSQFKPGTPAIPYMETGGTDAGFFRNAGIPTYGVSGMFVTEQDLARMHGRDERISVTAFRDLVSYNVLLIREVGRGGTATNERTMR